MTNAKKAIFAQGLATPREATARQTEPSNLLVPQYAEQLASQNLGSVASAATKLGINVRTNIGRTRGTHNGSACRANTHKRMEALYALDGS